MPALRCAFVAATAAFASFSTSLPALAQQGPVNGMRPSDPARYAITNAKVIVAPGQTLEKATIVIANGLIEAVGAVPGQPDVGAELMRLDETILVFPGGGRDILNFKGEEYQLRWEGRSGFARRAGPSVFDRRRIFRRRAERAGAG
jgi:hypothetical protein